MSNVFTLIAISTEVAVRSITAAGELALKAIEAATGQTLPTPPKWKRNPTRVTNRYQYWMQPPPTQSERCAWWARRIEDGFIPNRRISAMGYDDAAEFYGVYVWEYLNVIAPLIRQRREVRR